MTFDLAQYMRLRPFLYHLTARANLASLRRTRQLLSAAEILRRAQRVPEISVRRPASVEVRLGSALVSLRDQRPLHAGPILLLGGYSFADFVAYLNEHVFFWAGSDWGPAGRARSYGLGHYAVYENERPAILRVSLESVLRENVRAAPLFCQYNSGAPRCSRGKRAPRGPNTFSTASDFALAGAAVAEVTFRGSIKLPRDTQVGSRFGGPWKSL